MERAEGGDAGVLAIILVVALGAMFFRFALRYMDVRDVVETRLAALEAQHAEEK